MYEFTLDCIADSNGDIAFTVVSPESIAGINGSISNNGGLLTFDGDVLAFPLLTEGEISPVSAPWLMLRGLRSGYIRASGKNGEQRQFIIDDSYDADALQLDFRCDEQFTPLFCEILWQGYRILSISVENFNYQ